MLKFTSLLCDMKMNKGYATWFYQSWAGINSLCTAQFNCRIKIILRFNYVGNIWGNRIKKRLKRGSMF